MSEWYWTRRVISRLPNKMSQDPAIREGGTGPAMVVDTHLCDSVMGASPCSGLVTLFLSSVRANRENRLSGHTHPGV